MFSAPWLNLPRGLSLQKCFTRGAQKQAQVELFCHLPRIHRQYPVCFPKSEKMNLRDANIIVRRSLPDKKEKKWRIHSMLSGQRKRRVIFCERSSSSSCSSCSSHVSAAERFTQLAPRSTTAGKHRIAGGSYLATTHRNYPASSQGGTTRTSGHMFQNKTFNVKDYIHPKNKNAVITCSQVMESNLEHVSERFLPSATLYVHYTTFCREIV